MDGFEGEKWKKLNPWAFFRMSLTGSTASRWTLWSRKALAAILMVSQEPNMPQYIVRTRCLTSPGLPSQK